FLLNRLALGRLLLYVSLALLGLHFPHLFGQFLVLEFLDIEFRVVLAAIDQIPVVTTIDTVCLVKSACGSRRGRIFQRIGVLGGLVGLLLVAYCPIKDVSLVDLCAQFGQFLVHRRAGDDGALVLVDVGEAAAAQLSVFLPVAVVGIGEGAAVDR